MAAAALEAALAAGMPVHVTVIAATAGWLPNAADGVYLVTARYRGDVDGSIETVLSHDALARDESRQEACARLVREDVAARLGIAPARVVVAPASVGFPWRTR